MKYFKFGKLRNLQKVMYKVAKETFLNNQKNLCKTLLVPVATIGCGKTTLALALSKLFPFGHVQNDDVKTRAKFYKKINKEFENQDVVIADRNNHMKELRKTLIEAVKKNFSNVRVVAIYWNHEDRTSGEIFNITSERIISRGENHQNLTIENKDHIWRFLNDFERLDSNDEVDSQFDHVINLDIANDIKTNFKIVINRLKSIIGIEEPSEDGIENALEEIKYYRPATCKSVNKSVEKSKRAEYYGIALDLNVQDFLTKYYEQHPNEDSGTFNILVQNKRILPKHHITLIHVRLRKNELWKQYEELCESSIQQVKVYIDKVVFDSQIMALVVNRIDPPTIYSTNKIAHVTVGTVNSSVKPFQSNKICELALFGSHEDKKQSDIRVIDLEQELGVEGIVKAF